MPAFSTAFAWQREDDEFSQEVERARELGAIVHLEEAKSIADTPCLGTIETIEGDKTTIKKEDMLGHRRLQVETRLKLAAMIAPRRFGQKLDLTSGGEKLPAPANSVTLVDAKINSILAVALQRKEQGVLPAPPDALEDLMS